MPLLDAEALKIEAKSITWYFMYMEDVFKSDRDISGTKIHKFPKINTWMGALYYKNSQNLSEPGTINEGVYVYPDWRSCVWGTWKHHVLQVGVFCNVTGVDVDVDG